MNRYMPTRYIQKKELISKIVIKCKNVILLYDDDDDEFQCIIIVINNK